MHSKFSKIKTKSGTNLWVLSSQNYNSVSVGVVVKCGARDEIWPKEAGIAHALEHMHFQGTENFKNSKELTEYIEEIGGDINAWTNSEKTFYFSRVPTGYAERAVHIISEQMEKSIFPEKKILTEMKNIVQEIKRRDDNPNKYLWRLSDKFMYGSHPLSRDILGVKESIVKFTKKDFLNFKNKYYNPANYTFIVVGNISEDEALKLFNKYFSNKSKIDGNERKAEILVEKSGKQLVKNKELNQLHVLLRALIGSGDDRNSLYLEFFSDMISGGMSFPLFQEVRDKRGLCYSIGASLVRKSDFGSFDIYIGTDGKKYKEAISAIFEVINKSKSDKTLLNKVKKLRLGGLMLGYENSGSVVKWAANDIFFLGYPREFEEIKKEIDEVRIENINGAVDKYLKPESIYTVMLAPKDFVL